MMTVKRAVQHTALQDRSAKGCGFSGFMKGFMEKLRKGSGKGFRKGFRKEKRNMKKLKVGVIGVGRLGYEHACNIANRVPGMELVAICDGNAPRAEEVADELNVEKVYSDPAALSGKPHAAEAECRQRSSIFILPVKHPHPP